MTHYETSWINALDIRPEDIDKACKQVYVWLMTRDSHVVIVSKDGQQWQLPGGKPELRESLMQTATREVREETGLDITELSDKLQFFGYQIVNDLKSGEPAYVQIRYILKLDQDAADLTLSAYNEDDQQPEEDVIKFVTTASFSELLEKIPWMTDSPEFTRVQSIIAAF